MSDPTFTSSEMMTIAAAHMLPDRAVCFVGIGLPSTAANLARLTHAPELVLIYESGPIGAKPAVLPLSIGDGDLAETSDTVVSTPEIFRYWLQGGRIDIGFLSAAQIDRFRNLNTTIIGDYHRPRTRARAARRKSPDQRGRSSSCSSSQPVPSSNTSISWHPLAIWMVASRARVLV